MVVYVLEERCRDTTLYLYGAVVLRLGHASSGSILEEVQCTS